MTAIAIPRPLLLRPWSAGDLLPLRAAIDESLAEVQRWLPWGREEPTTLEQLSARIERYARDTADGTTWRLALVDDADGTILGSGALLRCDEPDVMEVGYWVRTGAAGQGLATRAAAALVRHAFDVHGVSRMELWTLPDNHASMAVARRLGFTWCRRGEFSRRGAEPQEFEIFELAALADLRAADDAHVRVELPSDEHFTR